ncbi:MAG: hypothetical protein GWM98_13180, partial [Nitrospinaceae bacterium]|nr:hypothetical protein [Nitrospinaceae bacterium]NIR55243.1 hypothetical protein [Nitrospinaceae bacterium]NIS85681.1 hypothetical protein [Nitrospinaceae bacterium]NIT82532.1 hypothetical protein [Nitrospinaceae bacterium]NIU44736.1 hypothetical protein [Nitrospinaceae bacterium]
MKHPINFILLLFLFVLGGHDVEANESPFEKKLNEFIGIALKNNPQLREAQNQIEAAQEVPPQASSLEDPMLMFELKNVPVDSFAFDERNMTQKQVTLSQRLP